ncbi:Uncharacterized protein TCM_009853 [Theobroma cacao]|uniref:Uncharacterized protein n=1 Tax=Theobroma cacao TaxID=3641 RepID=A0A061E6E9_THECC|nr:Uncharacterized protein TCM_009853 [Theobroma cacao]
MAPKRATASRFYDKIRFISPNAKKGYNEEWTTFCKQPLVAMVPLVREIYTNAKEHHNGFVLVHGKFLHFTFDAINAYFEIPTDLIDEYFTLEQDYEEIINYLCKGSSSIARPKASLPQVLSMAPRMERLETHMAHHSQCFNVIEQMIRAYAEHIDMNIDTFLMLPGDPTIVGADDEKKEDI